VEALIKHQLSELKMDEAQVLKGMTKVYKAKRAALVRAQEDAVRAESAGRPNRMSRGSKKITA
jgi:ATP-dependent RNA helicase DDX49/DBP8